MGSDDLFKKRKARKAASHQRERAKREPYPRLLIVCEGAKTEPFYFKAMQKEWNLNPRNVVIADKKAGLTPLPLVEYAIKEYNKAQSDFDHVYCVFDKDKHTDYQDALDKIRQKRLKGRSKLHAIYSVPSFEIWLLLHFKYTTRAFEAGLNNSNCDLVIHEIRHCQYISDYEKCSKDIFDKIKDKLDFAICNAKKLEEFHSTSGTDNPSTKVYLLVEKLRELNEYDDE